MNILHLLSQNSLTGAEVYAVSLAHEQIQNNHTVYQISNGFFSETPAIKTHLAVETKSKPQFLKSIFFLRRFIQEKNIHIIHAHSRAASKLAYYSTRGLKVGYVSTLHGRQHSSFSKKLMNIYGQFLIPVCQNIKKQLTQEFKYNPRFIKVIANGIDLQQFYFQPRNLIWSKSSGQILKIAVIGRMSGPKKNRTELFIANFSQILNKNNINFTVTTIESGKLDSNFYHQFDLICGSGRVCIEALLCGVPVIAFGESLYCGLVTAENYLQAKKSNFGDIGCDFKLPQFDSVQAEKDILILQSLTTDVLKKTSALADEDFSVKKIASRIERLYESSYFMAHYKKWIPILMYHKIPDQELQSQHKIFVTKDNFNKHLNFFKNAGFTTLTFSELAKYRKAQKDFSQFPVKPLILTFDDGYQDNLDNADPLLKKYGFRAEIFLLANANLQSNHWDYSDKSANSAVNSANNATTTTTLEAQEKHLLVTNEKRQLWKNSAFEIGSHGFSHERLPDMALDEKIHELKESKAVLEKEFQTKIITYAYTFGDTNAECAELAQASGYDYALNTDSGGLMLEEDPYQIFRVNIFPHETTASLRKKTSAWYRRYYYWKRKK